MPVLDANPLIRLSRQDAVAERTLRRLEGQRLVVPAQAALEHLTGIESDQEAELRDMEASFEVAHSDHAVLLEAARLRAGSRGTFRPRTADLWIAAHATAVGTYVVTTNERRFRRLGVPAWNYEKEPDPPA